MSLLYGLQNWGEAYLIPPCVMHEQRLAQVQINEWISQHRQQPACCLASSKAEFSCRTSSAVVETLPVGPNQKVHNDLTVNREHAQHPEY